MQELRPDTFTLPIRPPVPTPEPGGPPVVEIAVPVHNEEHVLETSIDRLHGYLSTRFPFSWRITIVDNASTDGTWLVARRLARELPNVTARHLREKGRGLALRSAWAASDAAVVAYMDVDLSTDLDALLPVVAPLVSGHSDLAIGSRLAPGSSVARGPKREFISRSYNLILRTVLATRVRDAQCGFKAVRADVARRLLPAIEDDGWFFDTELLVLAEHNGLRIHEVPVDWIDDTDSRVHVTRTALDDLRGTARLALGFATGRGHLELGPTARPPMQDDFGRRLVSFAAIGVAQHRGVARAVPADPQRARRDRCERSRGERHGRGQRVGQCPLHGRRPATPLAPRRRDVPGLARGDQLGAAARRRDRRRPGGRGRGAPRHLDGRRRLSLRARTHRSVPRPARGLSPRRPTTEDPTCPAPR